MSADTEFQKLIFSRVAAQLTTDSLSVVVTASPTPNQALPYIEIGEATLSDHVLGHEIEAVVETWSSKEGPHQIKQMQSSIRTALHDQQGLEAGGVRFTCVREEYSTSFIDRTGEFWHGIQRYRTLASTP